MRTGTGGHWPPVLNLSRSRTVPGRNSLAGDRNADAAARATNNVTAADAFGGRLADLRRFARRPPKASAAVTLFVARAAASAFRSPARELRPGTVRLRDKLRTGG